MPRLRRPLMNAGRAAARPAQLSFLAIILALGAAMLAPHRALAEAPASPSCTRDCERGAYNPDYLFATTRELRNSIGSPAAVAVLSPLTIAVDLALLPFEFVLGLFG